QRIRYYGLLGNRYRAQKLAHCRELLGMPAPEPPPSLESAKDYHERYEELTGCSLWQCPRDGIGRGHRGRSGTAIVTAMRPPRLVKRLSTEIITFHHVR